LEKCKILKSQQGQAVLEKIIKNKTFICFSLTLYLAVIDYISVLQRESTVIESKQNKWFCLQLRDLCFVTKKQAKVMTYFEKKKMW